MPQKQKLSPVRELKMLNNMVLLLKKMCRWHISFGYGEFLNIEAIVDAANQLQVAYDRVYDALF